MGHIDYRKNTREKAPLDPVWLTAGAQAGRLANYLAGRSDIAVRIAKATCSGAPACFAPLTSEMELAIEHAYGATPASRVGDIFDRRVQFDFPNATGLIFHEALHARFSTWSIEAAAQTLTKQELNALLFLEEGRIEKLGLQMFADNACFLRSVVLSIVMEDLKDNPVTELTPTRVAAQLLALTSARVDAGSVDFSDVANLESIITPLLGVDLFNQLRALWLEAQATHARDTEKLYDIARRWAKLVEDKADENGEGRSGGSGSEGEGEGGGASGGFMEEFMEELERAAETASIEAANDAADQQEAEEWREEAKQRSSEAKRSKEHSEAAEECFGKGTGPGAGTHTSSRLVETRAPRADERQGAVKLATLLEKAKYRERDEREVTSIIPPGRLRTRAIVQGAALKSKGIMAHTEPWRRTVRKSTDDPTLSVGIMVDISGSMGAAMQPMASVAWILSEAVRRIQGRAAMVYYGQGVFPVLKPGQHLDHVNVYSAPDGTEKFDQAFKALDGSLNLLTGSGARMLVVVSDGCYTSSETKAAVEWIAACHRAGVAVTWVTFDKGDDSHARIVRENGECILATAEHAMQEVAGHIGRSAAKALTKIGERR